MIRPDRGMIGAMDRPEHGSVIRCRVRAETLTFGRKALGFGLKSANFGSRSVPVPMNPLALAGEAGDRFRRTLERIAA